MNGLRPIALTQIDEGPRIRQDYGDIEGLAESIKQYGILSSLVVLDKDAVKKAGITLAEADASKPYLLLAGGRRFRASGIASVTTVPCVVFTHLATDDEIKNIELVENVQRKDLTFAERDENIRQIHELQKRLTNGDQRLVDTAKLLNLSTATVHQSIQRAIAIEERPELAQMKSASEVQSLLSKEKEAVIFAELARRATAAMERSSNAVDEARKKLTDSYILKPFEDGIKGVKDNTIDFIEFDGPYGVRLAEQKKGSVADTYNEIPEVGYLDWMRSVLIECHRVMRPGAWGVCWFSQIWYTPLLDLIREVGLTSTHLSLIWNKLGSGGQTLNPMARLGNDYETAFYFHKGPANLNKPGAFNVYNYRRIHQSKMIHPTERPIALIEAILTTFAPPNATVLVPCLGSGKTIMAANNVGMTAFGYDIDPQYKPQFTLRVTSGTPGKYTDPQ